MMKVRGNPTTSQGVANSPVQTPLASDAQPTTSAAPVTTDNSSNAVSGDLVNAETKGQSQSNPQQLPQTSNKTTREETLGGLALLMVASAQLLMGSWLHRKKN